MQFCPIMPIKVFENFGNASKCHMALVQHLGLPEYLMFFQRKLAQGETVILDNGAYEGVQTHPAQLSNWTRLLKPTVVVLPDAPGNMLKTVQRSMNFLETYGLPHGTEGMMVLHGEDGKLNQFLSLYESCPTKWVGFSRLTKNFGLQTETPAPWSVQRAFFAEHLHRNGLWRDDLTHHALGMLAGRVGELAILNKLNFHSCDSSAPIWRGLHGFSMLDEWPNYEYQPFCAEEASNLTQADINLQEVLSACGQG